MNAVDERLRIPLALDDGQVADRSAGEGVMVGHCKAWAQDRGQLCCLSCVHHDLHLELRPDPQPVDRQQSQVDPAEFLGDLRQLGDKQGVAAEEHPLVPGGNNKRHLLIDALAARLVLKPHTIDVIVASNLFGDILSDLAAAVAGSIGVAPSANLNPPRKYPSMFEPVHGSAPDIAGRGIANLVGQIWAAALMLEHLGEHLAAKVLVDGIEAALAEGTRTPDLGGTATTSDVGAAVVRHCQLALASEDLHAYPG